MREEELKEDPKKKSGQAPNGGEKYDFSEIDKSPASTTSIPNSSHQPSLLNALYSIA
jgi:hypothetical protein